MSDRKVPDRSWLHLFIPILLALIFGSAAWGIKLAHSSASRTQARIPTPTPTPSVTPTATATPSPDQVVVTQAPTVALNWRRIHTQARCVPTYAAPDRLKQLDCFPDQFLVIDLAQQQGGLSLCMCWYPGLPPRGRFEQEELWNICSAQEKFQFWIDSTALKEPTHENPDL